MQLAYQAYLGRKKFMIQEVFPRLILYNYTWLCPQACSARADHPRNRYSVYGGYPC